MMYTYTVFDGPPSACGPCAWPTHTEGALRALSSEGALRRALREARREARRSGQYKQSDRLWVLVWDCDDCIVADGSVEV